MSTTSRPSGSGGPPGSSSGSSGSGQSSSSASTTAPRSQSSGSSNPAPQSSAGSASTTAPPSTTSSYSLGGSPTILGPLTTAWSAPSECNIWQQFNYGEVVGGWNGRGCNDVGEQSDTSTCWPSATVTAPSGSLTNWGYYSPAYSCPVGYATACSSTNGPDGSSMSAPPGASFYNFQYYIGAGETALGCCPNGFACAETTGVNKCFSFGVRSTFSFTEASCAGATFTKSAQTVPFTTRYFLVPSSTTVTSYQFVAPLFQLVHKAADLPRAAPNTAASPQATTSAGAATSGAGRGGLSTGGIVAIAVIIPIVVLAAIIALVLFLLHKRKQKRMATADSPGVGDKAQLRHSPETDGHDDTDITRDPGYGIGYGKQAPPPDVAMAGAAAAAGVGAGREYYASDTKRPPVDHESRAASRSSVGRRWSLRSMFSEKMTYVPPDRAAHDNVAELEADHAHEMDAGPITAGGLKSPSATRVGVPSTIQEASTSAAVQNVSDPEPDPQELEAAKRISRAAGEAPEYAGPRGAAPAPGTSDQQEPGGTFLFDDNASKPVTPVAETALPPMPTQAPREVEGTASQVRLSKAAKVSQVDVAKSSETRDSIAKDT